jgi:hypothetical protein
MFDSLDGDGNDSNHWRGKEIIPLNEWIQLRGTPYALEYFPDDFDKVLPFLTVPSYSARRWALSNWFRSAAFFVV